MTAVSSQRLTYAAFGAAETEKFTGSEYFVEDCAHDIPPPQGHYENKRNSRWPNSAAHLASPPGLGT
jgi:hypothetical protein